MQTRLMATPKCSMRVGHWNVRTIWTARKADGEAREIVRHRLLPHGDERSTMDKSSAHQEDKWPHN